MPATTAHPGASAFVPRHLPHQFVPQRGVWRAVRTRPRQEKALARFLAARAIQHYLPLVERVRITRGRKSRAAHPLFPGYLFLAGERDDAFAATASKRAVQIIEIDDQEGFRREICQIDSAVSGSGSIELYPFAVVGRRCRVRRGPFSDLEGVITERLGPDRLVLSVSILGAGAALEIETDLLEPVD